MDKTQFTDLEKGKLFAFCQDKSMMDAVKKVMLADIYQSGVLTKTSTGNTNWAYNLVYSQNPTTFKMEDKNKTPEQLGFELRSMVMALTCLETAFSRVNEFNITDTPQVEKENPAL